MCIGWSLFLQPPPIYLSQIPKWRPSVAQVQYLREMRATPGAIAEEGESDAIYNSWIFKIELHFVNVHIFIHTTDCHIWSFFNLMLLLLTIPLNQQITWTILKYGAFSREAIVRDAGSLCLL